MWTSLRCVVASRSALERASHLGSAQLRRQDRLSLATWTDYPVRFAGRPASAGIPGPIQRARAAGWAACERAQGAECRARCRLLGRLTYGMLSHELGTLGLCVQSQRRSGPQHRSWVRAPFNTRHRRRQRDSTRTAFCSAGKPARITPKPSSAAVARTSAHRPSCCCLDRRREEGQRLSAIRTWQGQWLTVPCDLENPLDEVLIGERVSQPPHARARRHEDAKASGSRASATRSAGRSAAADPLGVGGATPWRSASISAIRA